MKLYTNVSSGTIEIVSLRNIVGKTFRLPPTGSVDLGTPMWSPTVVAKNQPLLDRYIRIGELSFSDKPPKPASKKRKSYKKKATTKTETPVESTPETTEDTAAATSVVPERAEEDTENTGG